MRPTARFLQQHKFVAGVRGGAPAALLPLVRRSRDLLAALAADADAGTLPAQCAPGSLPSVQPGYPCMGLTRIPKACCDLPP